MYWTGIVQYEPLHYKVTGLLHIRYHSVINIILQESNILIRPMEHLFYSK